MADINLTVYQAARSATAVQFTDSHVNGDTGNNYYINGNDGKIALIVQLTAVAGNIVIDSPNTVDGNAIADKTVALTQSKTIVFGPFPVGYYNDSQGRVLITVSAATDVMAVRI